jgi:integrase
LGELDDAAVPTTWTLPGTRAKNGRTHLVHLSEPATTILRAVPRVPGNGCLFAGRSAGGSIGAFSAMKATIDKALAEAGHPLPAWRFHDFRRAGVTTLAGMGFPPHVCDRLLNHLTGAIQGVAAVYQKQQFLAERKAALDAWASYVLAFAEGRRSANNVVALRTEAA